VLMAAVPLPAGGGGPGDLLLLPDPGEGVLNHVPLPPDLLPSGRLEDARKVNRNPTSLEDACVLAYLKYLENEIVTYISLTQSRSTLIKGVAKRMLQILKDDINTRLTGLASSVLREKMISLILSDRFPSIEHCNIYVPETSRDENDEIDDTDILVPSCPNICCTGAFVQEGMMGVIMSAEVRQLIFTNERVHQRKFPATLEFNVPVVLTHLLGATDGKVSQLERLVFSENFVKEETEDGANSSSSPTTRSRIPCLDQSDKQALFSRHFGQGNIYDTPDRRGIAVDLLILFRDIHPKGGQFSKLTELVLKNNIQCKLYSKATFQFEFLARIGFCCPKLRILDLFGTDTWADCLVALFFKDAFHSLHRYLYFMENEEEECSEYHPHDTTRYCQFCFDQWHPNQIERPHTNNPVIPLLDSVYDHVIKRYPRRSYCILRNCVRVSDLIKSPQDTCFELTRGSRGSCTRVQGTYSEKCAIQKSTGVRTRARSRQSLELTNKDTCPGQQHQVTRERKCSCSHAKPRAPPPGLRRSLRSGANFGVVVAQGEGRKGEEEKTKEERKSGDRWVMARRAPGPPGKVLNSGESDRVSRSSSKATTKPFSIILDSSDKTEGVMTRSRKRKIIDSVILEVSLDIKAPKRSKQEKKKFSLKSSKVKGERLKRQNSKSLIEESESVISSDVASEPKREDLSVKIDFKDWEQECLQNSTQDVSACQCSLWNEPDSISYREIVGYPHLNHCVHSLEILNIGGSNVLGEFIPFLLLHTPKLKSLGQWLNTMIYGLEILKDLPGYENYKNYHLQELSYSSDRNYFCQPYIGFVPESQEFKNVRKEMLRYSNRSAKRVGHKARCHQSKRKQICDDVELMVTTCPNLRKMNLVVHYKNTVIEAEHGWVWQPLLSLEYLTELDLVTMKLENIRSLLDVIGHKLERLTVECDEEQGTGSEIVHIARSCPNITSLRLLLGDKVLRGEQTLHFGQTFFRKLEKLTVEGNVHLHGFAFLWGHCQNLKYIRIGLVVSNDLTNTNVLIQDVFTLLFQVNKMVHLEEMHIKNLKVRSLGMATLLLDNLPSLKRASNWFLDLNGEDMSGFKKHLKKYKAKGLKLDYKEW